MRHFKGMLLLFLCTIISVQAQQPKKLNSSQIFESVQKLNVLGSVMYIAAHPDDENTRLIAYMANHVKARTAYLALTRGDGGQNLIGPEIRELLGIMRTQELLAARRVDGGEQRFTRANDFGYSKHPDETLDIWDKDKVLSDVVWAIRTFKPDVIINRFDHRTPGTTHGHHTSSAILSLEAFDLVNDASKYSSQLSLTDTWQPKRLFFNTGRFFFRNEEDFNKASENLVNFDVGVYYPLKGLSNNEVASLASSQHLCQGFGRLTTRGSQNEYLELLKGDALGNNPSDVFEGIDTSWNRIEGGQIIGDILTEVEANFNFADPSSHLPQLLRAYKMLQNVKNEHWKTIKTKELKAIIEAVTGLYIEASANTPTAANNEAITLRIEALNRSNASMQLSSYNLTSIDNAISKNIVLEPNKRVNLQEGLTIPSNINHTSAYWLDKKGTLGTYTVEDQALIGKPETPRAITITFNLNIEGVLIAFEKPVVYRYSKPDKGELYRPFEITPPVSASLKDKVFIFENDKQKDIEVIVKAGKDNVNGFVKMAYPKDWLVYPEQQKINITNKGDIQKVIFTVIPPKNQSEGFISPMVNVDGEFYSKELIEIDYSHIPFQTVLLPSESKIVRLDISKRGNNIGYIEGAGDVVPESLRQIGYNVTIIKPEQISPENLSKFDAIVVGIRAYNIVDELKFKQKHLLNFVKEGGNLVIQYNTNRRLKVDNLSPFPLQLSRDRVTDENAEIRILNPQHPLLNFPNKISEKDFEGWVQERGLYFPNEWSDEFTPLLAANDKGETSKEGSLLIAKYGKGNYIYTGLSFFREFPAGVSGAYRLFANMLSAGKENIKQGTKLND
ncbi:PIG-L family deacetylase [Winogradskyella immobilis]|uniref:PIG-L family deacetylase n=1 Tax=Winogradskyella immobilis TaxID=2816852 RepID=A0ABS8EM21_9FLAO|nr:PIG-L family deacetylase [Winogradskyella immobilis]MCC1484268.1 PIG-L family deacetylase [Winogradskyella immobilis]MCG0016360.1 PIG-L family deacetylase [Winogradskyella immobilis]